LRSLRDSIHRNINVEDWALDILDTREMQRLRRIRQLGTAYLVYPGANHTRFEHVLGTYKLAQDASRALALPPEDARHVQAAALLHDVGHGPFSHLSEEIAAGPKHEELSVDLIQWSGINDLLQKAGLEPRRVAEIMVGKTERGRIVSGDIDVDRMDYLVRDAHYTGVRVSVDPERLLMVMTLQGGEFLVREEGLTAAESLLVARFLMYPAVYYHHACRSADVMIVAGAQDLLEEGVAEFEQIRSMDDAELISALKAGTVFSRSIATRIEERRLYKRVFEGTAAAAAADPLLRGIVDDERARARIAKEIADACGLTDGQVILDVPPKSLAREVGAKVLMKDGRVVPLREASTLVRTLVAAQTDHWRFWVFAPREVEERVSKEFARLLESPKSVKPPAQYGARS
jgi:uncharacterized protein